MTTEATYPTGPFGKVIVGIDHRHTGADAVALARALLAHRGCLVLAHVSVQSRGHPDPVIGRVQRRRALALLADVRDRTHLSGPSINTAARSVSRGLHELAIAEGADLLVVGSCHRASPGQVMTGESTSRALNGAPGAIAIAPLGYAAHAAPLRKIGSACDASPESHEALAIAHALGDAHGASVTALEAAHEDETPAAELIRRSASVDLLVVGSRGLRPIERRSHPSVSRALARGARCPLLVLTPIAPTMAPRDLEPSATST